MNLKEKKQYLDRIKYHLTMALRLVEDAEDSPTSREQSTSINQQMKLGYEASNEMLRHQMVTPPAQRSS